MKSRLLILFALFAAVVCNRPLNAQSPPSDGTWQQAWVAQYNGAYSYWEEVTDLAIGDGCVYVTGFEYTDLVTRAYATVKYDYSGQQLWVRNYGLGGTNGSAQANAVAVDNAGNVFVTGWSYDYDPGPPFEQIINDAATLKYDADGNLLWEHRYRLPGINNQPYDIVIDSAGNAYVTGGAWVGDGFDLMLLKYSPDGVLLWDRTIGKTGDRWDAGFAVALDPDENPVAAGYTEPFLFSQLVDGYLVKYNSSGDLVWQRDRESCSNGLGWRRIVINSAGQIYAFGEIAPWRPQSPVDVPVQFRRHSALGPPLRRHRERVQLRRGHGAHAHRRRGRQRHELGLRRPRRYHEHCHHPLRARRHGTLAAARNGRLCSRPRPRCGRGRPGSRLRHRLRLQQEQRGGHGHAQLHPGR
ncbi:MAG: SBBP repeat-containing protein [Phycisphaerales bacterium]|nr:SBBP repeat-containing protein [Phycisphaerales bacterium]